MSASQAVDINQLDLMNEPVEVDSNASSEEFFNPPLPDDGEHTVVMALGNRGVKAERQWEGEGKNRKRTGAGFLNIHLALKALKPTGGEGGTIAFDQFTTIVMESAGTSRAHAAFDLAGFKLTERTLGGLKDEIERAIAQHPKVGIVTRWEAQVNVGTKENQEWENVCVGQKNFPQILDADGNPTGRYSPDVFYHPKKAGAAPIPCRAQVRVVKYQRLS